MSCFKRVCCLLLLIGLAGCGSDLIPSGADKRPPVQSGTVGPRVSQIAPDFTVSDSHGNPVMLSSVLSSPTTSGVVLYFTMWCPICTSDMSLIRDWTLPSYPHVEFFAVDYVSASVSESLAAEIAN